MAHTVLKPFSFVKDGKVVQYTKYGTVVDDLPASVAKDLIKSGKVADEKKAPEPPQVAESTPKRPDAPQ